MKALERNKRDFWYCLYLGETEVRDGDGNYTGETEITYSYPIAAHMNISPATGQSNMEMFGNLADYDRVIVTDDVNTLIDENTVMFVEVSPIIDGNKVKGYDYIVSRVAKSLNSVSIALQKVSPDNQDTVLFSPADFDGVLTINNMFFGAGV